MARLRSARLTNDTLVSQIDDFLGELEEDLAAIFGFDLDVDITATAFGCDNSGRLTKDLIRWANGPAFPDPFAYHIINSTNSAFAYVGLLSLNTSGGLLQTVGFGSNFAVANIPPDLGTEYDLDATFPGFLMLAGGQLLGYLFTSSAKGLCPRGSGNSDEYLCANGRFQSIDRPSQVVMLSSPQVSGSGIIPIGSTQDPTWAVEDSDEDGLHAADDDDIIVIEAGKHLVGAQFTMTTAGGTGYAVLTIHRDRAGVITEWSRVSETMLVTGSSVQAEALIDCSVGDKLYANIDFEISKPVVVAAGYGNAHLWAARVSS